MWWITLQGCAHWLFDPPEADVSVEADAPVEAPPVVVDAVPFPTAPATFRPWCLAGAGDGRTGALRPSRGGGPLLLPMLLPSCSSRPDAAPASEVAVAPPITATPPMDGAPEAEPAAASPAPDPMPEAKPAPTPAPAPAPARRSARAEHSERTLPAKPRDHRSIPEEPQTVAPVELEKEVAVELPPANERQTPPGSKFDWGGTVFLSNDDSMSLASAQRVLYALTRGVGIRPSEVRPHELLNYFSFDTVAPVDGQTFGVLGGAVRDGDQLTVALAVRGASPPRPPLDLTLVVDRSGSMLKEDKITYTKRGLARLAENLNPGDRLDVVLFDTEICTPLEGYVVGRDNPAWLAATINGIAPRGGTDLGAGLDEAYRIQNGRTAAETHGRARRVLLVTDALLNDGNVDPGLIADVGAAFDQHDIRLSGVGVGRDFDDRVLDRLTEKGRGAYVYLGSEAVVDRVFGAGFDSLVQTVATDVRFSLDLPPSLAMEKFYGEEMSGKKEDLDATLYQAGTTQLFLQDLKIRDGVVVPEDPVSIRIEYRDGVTDEPAVQELRTTVGALLDSDPHNVRKGRALMAFADLVTALAMGNEACGAPLGVYRSRVGSLADDAEIAFVNGLVGKTCGVSLATTVVHGVELKVRVDADVPVDGVGVVCGGDDQREELAPNDTVALFASVQPGSCTVRLEGTTLAAQVDVSRSGSDLRCVVRGGRLSCG